MRRRRESAPGASCRSRRSRHDAFAKRMRWYAPATSRSSSSAWATAVRKSTSHSVGRFHLVGDAALQQPQERHLRDPLRARADGGVGHRPVHRQPEVLPEMLERLLVLGRQSRAQLDEVRPRDRDWRAWPAWRAARTPGRTGGAGRTARRSSSGRGVRWAGRCRPSPSGRTPRARACAGTGRCSQYACRRRRGRRAATRSPSAAACRWRRPGRGASTGRTGRCRRAPSARSTSARALRGQACRGR